MNNLQIFNNSEFGDIRTLLIDGEPWFVGKDVATILGYVNPTKASRIHVDEDDRGSTEMDTPGGKQEVSIINESGLYSLIFGSKMEKAKQFKRWVTSEVLPELRKTGTYSIPKTPQGQIKLLAQGFVDLEKRVGDAEGRMDRLEFDIPLYGAESDELAAHVKRKGCHVLGGKDSEAYQDIKLRQRVYRDIYSQLKREFGIYDDDGHLKSYKHLKRKFLADAHEFVDTYEPATILLEEIHDANSQLVFEW